MGEKLNESRVHEDARAEAVEDTRDQGRAGRARVVCRAHAEANCNTYGRRDAVEECADVWNVAVFRGKGEVRQSRTNAEAFERFCDGRSVSTMVGVDGGYIRWKMMTTKRTLNLSSTAKVRPIRTLKKNRLYYPVWKRGMDEYVPVQDDAKLEDADTNQLSHGVYVVLK